jgi:Flp pilus assembly protein TadB
MQLVSIKAIIAMLWVSTVCVVVIAGNLNAVASWFVLAVVAVVPPLVVMWRWNDPRQTMSESIQEVLR